MLGELTQLETVALWTSVIVGVAGVVLAIVAITFAERVNTRAAAVNDQTIKSLEKVESTVGHLSEDTNQLIKAAWDKLLGTVGPTVGDDASTRQVAAGLAEELRRELIPRTEPTPASGSTPDIDEIVNRLEASIAAQLRAGPTGPAQPSQSVLVDMWRQRLADATPVQRALIPLLASGGHLTADQFNRLVELDTPVAAALRDAREHGWIVPLGGHDDDEGELVYWFRPQEKDAVRTAVTLLGRPDRQVLRETGQQLQSVDYRSRLIDASILEADGGSSQD